MKVPDIKNHLDDIIANKRVSRNDLAVILKTVAALAANLFLIVIDEIAGILKTVLPFLK